MKRRIIRIDDTACNGCGACAKACHEGAIKIVDGKARLIREDFCDGFGDCLPECPTGAITFEEREAPEYDAAAVASSRQKIAQATSGESRLSTWPVQLRLVPSRAPFFDGADLLIAADCTAYAYARLHDDFMAGRVTLIGCPKLDPVDYAEKLSEIINHNDIKSVTVIRMEVPCCGALARAAAAAAGCVPLRIVTVSRDGRLI